MSTKAAAALHRPVFFALALICIIASITIRITGPSDIHDQTQPKTLSYTTDIVTHAGELGHWILPSIQQVEPASKPPLYNWLAVPFVAICGHQSIIAHKAPSLLSWLALILIIFRLGNRIDPIHRLTGPLAVTIFVTNYAWFKLGYLARPDALLSLWLIIGWYSATLLAKPPSTGTILPWLIMWTATGLAALTKGPAALLIPVYAIILHLILNRLRSKGGTAGTSRADVEGQACLSPSPLTEGAGPWGSSFFPPLSSCWLFLPVAIVIPAAWLTVAYFLNPDHTHNIIIREEVVDRFLGIGAEGTKSGPWDWIRTAPNMPLFFMLRFLPWSLLFVGAAVDLLARPRRGSSDAAPVRGWPDNGGSEEAAAHPWIQGAFIYTIVVVIFFSFSAGKRADYIASAYVTGSLVVGWWLAHRGLRLACRVPWIVPTAALITLTGLAVNDSVWGFSAIHQFGDSTQRFVTGVRQIIADSDDPLVFYECNHGPFQIVQVLMGQSQIDESEERSEGFVSAFATVNPDTGQHDSLWVITQPDSLVTMGARPECRGWSFVPILISEPASTSAESGDKQIALYRASRAQRPPTH